MEACASVGMALVRRLVETSTPEAVSAAAIAAAPARQQHLPRLGPDAPLTPFDAMLQLQRAVADTGSNFVAVFGYDPTSVSGYCRWVLAQPKHLDHQVSVELAELAFGERAVTPAAAAELLELACQQAVAWLRGLALGQGITTYQLEAWVDTADRSAARSILEQVFTGGQCGFRDIGRPKVMLVRREPAVAA